MSMFDGMLLETERTTRVFLVKPDGNPLQDKAGKRAYIDVYSTDSRVAASALKRLKEKRAVQADGKQEAADDDEVSRAREAEAMAELTAGWYLVKFNGDPLVDDNGAPLGFSTENARLLYSERGADPWLVQARRGAALQQNFMPALPSA